MDIQELNDGDTVTFPVTRGSGDGPCVFVISYEDILELTEGDSWTKLGRMKKARSSFGVSVIEYKLYENNCK